MAKLFFTWSEIESVLAGRWLLPPKGDGVVSVLDDSRKCEPGCLFVAVVGELADGHDYVRNAAVAKSAAVLVQREPNSSTMDCLRENGCGCYLVDDGLAAFQKLANAHRRRFQKLPILAVTGSCGKTSTKEMCAAVLNVKWPRQVIKTIGNTNNHFGVPRNLLRITEETCAAVIEAGSNHPGEIASLGRIIEPTNAIISCIGAAHLEFFKDLDGVAEEKGDIYEASSPDGVAVMPFDCHGKETLKAHAGKRRIITFGLAPEADVQAIYGGMTENGYAISLIRHDTGERIDFTWGIGGECQAGNASGAAAVGIAFGMELKEIAEGLKSCELPGARMAIIEADGVKWVNDAYNANPDSMRASLAWFKEISKSAEKRFIVIGDMRELGEGAATAHEEILEKAISEFPGDVIITIGETFAPFAEKNGIKHFANVEEAKTLQFPQGAWVFLKSSFGTGLYKLAPQKA